MNTAKVFAELRNQTNVSHVPRINVNLGFSDGLAILCKTIVRLKMTSLKYNGST